MRQGGFRAALQRNGNRTKAKGPRDMATVTEAKTAVHPTITECATLNLRGDATMLFAHPSVCELQNAAPNVAAVVRSRPGWSCTRAASGEYSGPADDGQWLSGLLVDMDSPQLAAASAVAPDVSDTHGEAFIARYDGRECCIHCGNNVDRGQTVRYSYYQGGRTLVHAACVANR